MLRRHRVTGAARRSYHSALTRSETCHVMAFQRIGVVFLRLIGGLVPLLVRDR